MVCHLLSRIDSRTLLSLLAKIKVLVLGAGTVWYPLYRWYVQVLCIVTAQGGGRCHTVHTVNITPHSTEGCCTATPIAPLLWNRSGTLLWSWKCDAFHNVVIQAKLLRQTFLFNLFFKSIHQPMDVPSWICTLQVEFKQRFIKNILYVHVQQYYAENWLVFYLRLGIEKSRTANNIRLLHKEFMSKLIIVFVRTKSVQPTNHTPLSPNPKKDPKPLNPMWDRELLIYSQIMVVYKINYIYLHVNSVFLPLSSYASRLFGNQPVKNVLP